MLTAEAYQKMPIAKAIAVMELDRLICMSICKERL